MRPGPYRAPALDLWLKAVDQVTGHRVLRGIAQEVGERRLLVRGAGVAGDAQYIPWLINLATDETLARLAGKSFTTITGLNLTDLELDRKQPTNFAMGPSDDPADADVGMDPDDGLPWPDQHRIQAWWDANRQRYQSGVRYFMGEPVSVPNCERVLREGHQRQRRAAADYLCLLTPGRALFPTAAPAWRQARWLAAERSDA